MARTTKKPDERKDEIIQASQRLFIEKGFVETKISDIVKSIGVSQGIFYYYFNSKNEVIDKIIDRYVKKTINCALKIIKDTTLSGVEKLEKMSENQLVVYSRENNRIHSIKGVDIHDRILKRLILDYVPLMQKALSESDNNEIQFMMEIFVTAGNVLFDPGIFQWDKEERNERINFLICFMEKSLNVPEGTLNFYKKLMGFVE